MTSLRIRPIKRAQSVPPAPPVLPPGEVLTIAQVAAALAKTLAIDHRIGVTVWLQRGIEAGRIRSVRVLGVPHLPRAEALRLINGGRADVQA